MSPVSHESLHVIALECVKNYKRSERDLLNVLSEIDQTRGYLPLGVSSLFRYCVEKLGLSESETARFTQVTRKSQEVPALREAIDQGLLTVSKASRIAPVITNATGGLWISIARTLNHREIEREVAKVNPKSIRRDKIEIRTVDRSELRVTISSELATKIKRVQEVLGARNLEETLEKLVDLALKQKDPLAKAERNLKRETKGLEVVEKTKTSEKSLGQPATWQTQGTDQQAPLPWIEKAARPAISAQLKHAIFNRDQGQCGFKKCGERKWLHMHHIQPLSMGGKNELGNLMLICSNHHSMMHKTQMPPLRTAAAIHRQ